MAQQWVQEEQQSRSVSVAVHAELQAGLCADIASISPKYFYNALGSTLFEAICALPEYYPTRTESAIIEQHANDIAAAVGTDVTLIDLGAGNCAKAARLFPLLRPHQYVPIDISAAFLHDAVRRLQMAFPALPMHAIAMDFSSALQLPSSISRDKRLFFYPGSSLGNFAPDEALQFLCRLRHCLQRKAGDGVLLGVDLVKEPSVLDAAYDDALGVTAAFNRNMLLHVNQLLGADFDVADWLHRGFFNLTLQRVEMHLEAKRDVNVTWSAHGSRHFRAGERIHTENSYKFTPEGLSALLKQAGFGVCKMWFDARKWCMICHAKPI